MRLCSGCKDWSDSPRYCSTDCQRTHWKVHKKKTCLRKDKHAKALEQTMVSKPKPGAAGT